MKHIDIKDRFLVGIYDSYEQETNYREVATVDDLEQLLRSTTPMSVDMVLDTHTNRLYHEVRLPEWSIGYYYDLSDKENQWDIEVVNASTQEEAIASLKRKRLNPVYSVINLRIDWICKAAPCRDFTSIEEIRRDVKTIVAIPSTRIDT